MDKALQSTPPASLRLSLEDQRLAICRLGPASETPPWLPSQGFCSVTRTADELSLVCPEESVPNGVEREGGWRALGVEGPLDFSLTGILASVASPLAAASVGIFAVSTYNTDYVLVKEEQLGLAVTTLRAAGHEVRTAEVVVAIRPATREDEGFLWRMLAEAAHEPTMRAVAGDPGTARYVEGWGGEGDLGFIAVSSQDRPVGAAWLRLLTAKDRGYGYLDDETPELAIAACPQVRGSRVGTRLLQQLLEASKSRYRAMSLSVRPENPAVRLYERMGFEVVESSERTNRRGGTSLTMRRDLV